jgi:hypothetical protein
MKISRPYKDKPWLVMEESGFWESLFFGCTTRVYIDTKHPEWWNKVVLPTIKEMRKYGVIS